MTRLSIRVTVGERELLKAAAKQAHSSLSGFVRHKAIEAAELALSDQRGITIPTEAWEPFESLIHSPLQDLPKLRKLMASRPVWEN